MIILPSLNVQLHSTIMAAPSWNNVDDDTTSVASFMTSVTNDSTQTTEPFNTQMEAIDENFQSMNLQPMNSQMEVNTPWNLQVITN